MGIDIPKRLFRKMHGMGELIKEILSQLPVATSIDEIAVSDTTQEINLEAYHTEMITEAAASVASLADGEITGQRKLLTLKTLGTAGDTISLDATNIHNAAGTQATGVTFDAEDEFLLIEWTGAEWQEIYGSATITTV